MFVVSVRSSEGGQLLLHIRIKIKLERHFLILVQCDIKLLRILDNGLLVRFSHIMLDCTLGLVIGQQSKQEYNDNYG
ncbi:hypothetical protein D3C71_1818120 [compost metagenome]